MRGGDILSKRIICLLLSMHLFFSAFLTFAASDVTMYSSDGRTITVSSSVADEYKKVGWYDTYEDAQLITMYAADGRTIEIPAYYRDAYRKVGWYDTLDEVSITMYATDGRTLSVFKDLGEAYRKVGWYYSLSDVSVTMYDESGGEHTVYNDYIEDAQKKGWSKRKSDVMQLMFSDDGRFIYVPYDKAEAYSKVGWYYGGGRVDPSRPMVALTFDDGPGKYTDSILSTLEKYGARATFFVQGHSVAGYKSTVLRAVDMGCEIGNHTWSHVNLQKSSTSVISSQISQTNNAVFNAAGVYPTLYRPPYGAYNKSVLSSISMSAVMWSVDTLDWKTRSAAKTLDCIKKNTSDGAIILMHDIHSPTKDAVVSVVPYLLKQGYQLVTVSELIKARCGTPVSGKVYSKISR